MKTHEKGSKIDENVTFKIFKTSQPRTKWYDDDSAASIYGVTMKNSEKTKSREENEKLKILPPRSRPHSCNRR